MTRHLTRLALVAGAASVIVPFLVIVSASLQPQSTLAPGLVWPSDPQWGNYADAWTTAGFGSLLKSSLVIACGVVPIAVVLATLAGFGLSSSRVVAKGPIFALLMLGLALPYESLVIPLYYDMRATGLLNTYWAVILPLIGAFMPFGVFWMRGNFDAMPPEVIEAAEIDGATGHQILRRILIPTARPALTTLALLYFMWAWNHFLLALILIQDPAMRTAPSGLGKFVQQFGRNIPLLSAGTITIITPIVLLYLFFQRHFVRGILQGAIK